MAVSPTVTVRLADGMDEWLAGRSERALAGQSLAARARAELWMWRDVLAAELAQQRWSLGELGMIADVCNSPIPPDAVSVRIGHVAMEVADAVRLDAPQVWSQKWGVDADALVARLSRLSPAGDIALMDAVARWWAMAAPHTVEGWASVGLTTKQ